MPPREAPARRGVARGADADEGNGAARVRSVHKRASRRADVLHLLFGQLRIDRQREHFFGGAFGLGQIAALLAHLGEARLLVEAKRIVSGATDRMIGEVLLERIARAGANHVLVVNGDMPVGDE